MCEPPPLDVSLDEIAEGGNYVRWILDRARPHLRGRVLDAGAGTGTFTEALVHHADEVVALEPEARFAEVLAQRFAREPRVRVVPGDAEHPPPSLGAFDAIVCFNVLEHIPDDEAALCGFRALLRPEGALLLLVPAHPELAGPFDEAIGHQRRYRRDALEGMLREAGFTIETLPHVNPVGAIGWAVRIRLLRQHEWPRTSFRLFDRLVPVLRPLDALRLPFGLSLWAVARPTRG